MKNLIVYYSLTGKNEKVALKLKEIMNCEIEQIVEPVNRHGFLMFFKNGFDALMKKTAKIEPIKSDIKSFERVIFLTPVWAGNLPPAARSFLMENKDKLKNLVFISACGMGKKNEKLSLNVEGITNKKLEGYLFIRDNDVRNDSYIEKLKTFVG
jgi:flavodoxin